MEDNESDGLQDGSEKCRGLDLPSSLAGIQSDEREKERIQIRFNLRL